MIKRRVSLSQLKSEMWTEEQLLAIEQFILDRSQRLLVFFVDSVAGFTASKQCPVFQVEELQYFIRKEGVPITLDMKEGLQFGKVRGNYIESLLRHMTAIYAPMFFQNSTWPDSILFSLLKDGCLNQYSKCL